MSSVGSGEPLTRVESYQYPAAHIGHLSQAQNGALEKFKSICEQNGYYRPASAGHPASHDDETLLRYLRARKFVPNDAFGQFKDTEDWRKENRIDNLYDTIDIEDYDATRRLYPQWTGRRDKRGIPVYVFEVAGLTSKRMSEYEHSVEKSEKAKGHSHNGGKTPAKLLRLFALYENLIQFALPLCTGIPDRPYGETPVSQSNNIVDISGVGLKQFWNLKGHMQDASTLATAHYPETLDRIFIIGAPSFFPTVWNWIKKWFDPITVSKIFILSQSSMKSTLEQYIEPENIPKKYGGRLDWDWGDLPILDRDIQSALHWENPSKGPQGQNAFPSGPVRWQTNEKGEMVAIAVGTVHGKQRNQRVATIPAQSSQAPASLSVPAGTAAAARRPAAVTHKSTSGYHTHPAEGTYSGVDEMPPPDDEEETRASGGATGAIQDGPYVMPIRSQNNGQYAQQDQGRQGTSTTRYNQQAGTHAAGQMQSGTPALHDSGYGDRTAIMETSTVGQARKDVSLPERQHEEAADNSYLSQAKALAEQAYESTSAVVGAASHTVLAAAGYGEAQTQQTGGGSQEQQHSSHQSPVQDPRVDNMQGRDVEDFLRSQYSSTNRIGHRKIDQIKKSSD